MPTSKEVSAMIRQGFISDPALSFSQSPTSTTVVGRVFGSPNSKTLLSPPPTFTTTTSSPSSSPSNGAAAAARPTQHPTLFQMMSEEQALEQFRQRSQSKVSKILREFEGLSGMGTGDVRLTVVGREGRHKISIDVHRRVLVEKSGFFREKLKGREKGGMMLSVEIISDCDDDVEIYLEAVVLMYYCDDLHKRLLGEPVSKVLALLKVSAAIMFEVGIKSCLEYLEAVPWSVDEEEKVISHLSELDLLDPATEALQRVSCQLSTSTADDIFLNLLNGVLQAKDEKARREMKALLSRLFRQDSSDHLDVSKETLYSLCQRCIDSLILCLSEQTALVTEIAREAENLHWIVGILIDKKLGDDFVKLWADQKELASLHSKIPIMYRHEISKITAQLCIAIGRGEIMVGKEIRFALLSNWLEPLYDDFGWMKRAFSSRTVDKKLVEDGIGQTILTLPLLQQQGILLRWFDRFLNKGDDCPNIQRAFEIWWRRAFIRQYSHETMGNSKLQTYRRGYMA
ncbi:BTB/POZ domain-containing protein At5g60050 [Linum grandiflorum]